MANPGQPTISLGASGDAVKRLERALRRTPNPGLAVDGVFGAQLATTVKQFQQGAGLTADGIVGPATWAALPDGGPMPVLQVGSSGPVVRSLQTLLTNGAPGQWITTPQGTRRRFRTPYEGLGRRVPGLGRRRARRNRRRPDLVRFAPCGQRHSRDRRGPAIRDRLKCAVVEGLGQSVVRRRRHERRHRGPALSASWFRRPRRGPRRQSADMITDPGRRVAN